MRWGPLHLVALYNFMVVHDSAIIVIVVNIPVLVTMKILAILIITAMMHACKKSKAMSLSKKEVPATSLQIWSTSNTIITVLVWSVYRVQRTAYMVAEAPNPKTKTC